jgi:chromate transporter
LFVGFLSVGVTGFGGVMPFIRRMVVERRRWVGPAEFTDTLALCQLLPGPNVTNLAINLGARYHGLAGAAVSVAGLIAAPFAIVVILGALLTRLDVYPVVGHAMSGMAAAAAGLVLGTALKIGRPLLDRIGRDRWLALAVAAGAFAAVALLRLPLLPVLLVAGPLSVGLHALWRPR